ncbi:MAG: transketolase [Ilumatobacter coccineus]|uniref:Transketolase n=1 Tax=Ilumatobacter coccineus TaxID=467094 RepID=A0A2G6K7V4_9ACTN|nr:MAG: transketolase [Ilumatobacter coccineus]
MALSSDTDRQAINLIRGLSMDAPLAAKSGHQGTALALAPLAHVLYSRIMSFDPADPAWPDRDRFVLSIGHASILQYAMLYLSGFGLELDDLKAFRQWGSATPGHPEAGHTAGVEVTTGPLGQGFANAVGMALAERILADKFGSDALDHFTYVIAGDGCLMEGVSHEAASLAGHLKLNKLIAIYDDNRITIDGSTDLAYSDDVPGRFRAYGWEVNEVGEIADDLDALEAAIRSAQTTDRPSLIVLRSHIGYPSPRLTDDPHAHGLAFTAEDVTATKEVMGIPDEPFWAPDEVVSAYRRHVADKGAAARAAWHERNTDLGPEWDAAWHHTGLEGWDQDLPSYELGDTVATRQAVQAAIQATEAVLPGLVSGSADLTGNTGTRLAQAEAQSADQPGGHQVYYGIREHGMGSAMVGMALHGGVIPVGGTFFAFLDYMRPAVRLAALSQAPAIFVWTHDSVGVGEDGPTHQPIEHLSTLRAIPDLHVIRPADGNETIAAWVDAVNHDGPTALVLSRQGIEVVTDGSAVATGAGIVAAVDTPQIVLVGTGSEVALCAAAARTLAENGIAVQVVSMPSWDRFEAQPDAFRRQIFPAGVPVLAVEAASSMGWHRYADDVVSIDRFGASAPASVIMTEFGLTPDAVADRARALLS